MNSAATASLQLIHRARSVFACKVNVPSARRSACDAQSAAVCSSRLLHLLCSILEVYVQDQPGTESGSYGLLTQQPHLQPTISRLQGQHDWTPRSPASLQLRSSSTIQYPRTRVAHHSGSPCARICEQVTGSGTARAWGWCCASSS